MKTLLYEIRYYLIATLLVIWLVPDHGKAPVVQERKSAKPFSTIRKDQIKYPAYLRVGPDREWDTEFQLLLEEEMKKEKKDFERDSHDLFPEPNRY
ncbi:hypothetical protein F9K33_04175 [bacterium]|nr:MAG: hypothetical protein F9K33_04175 [bacterium]MBL7959630.1 hypothetical protein [bacterium]